MANTKSTPATESMTRERVRKLFDYREDGHLIHRVGGGRWGNWPKAGAVAGTESLGYRLVRVGDVLYRVHRLVYLWHRGYMPKEIDHINGDGLDNRIENLRDVTRSENNWNRKVRGTSLIRSSGRWRAHIVVNNKQKHLGTFGTEEEAHAAYIAAKADLHAIGSR